MGHYQSTAPFNHCLFNCANEYQQGYYKKDNCSSNGKTMSEKSEYLRKIMMSLPQIIAKIAG
jgi:hypothetical protein